MRIYRTYFKLNLLRYRMSYLYIIFSIIATYVISSIITIYIDNIMFLSAVMPYQELHYIYVSIRTIVAVGGITLLIYQYYNIMKSGTRDYCILKVLGATKRNISKLIQMQVVILILITIPLGIFLGTRLTNLVFSFFADVIMSNSAVDRMDSSNTILLTSVSLCIFIICIGIFLEIRVRKISLSKIISDSNMMWNEVE